MLRDALAAFQPQEIGFIADPYPAYDELRLAGRIHYDERTDHWLITRHADVNALLRDRRFGRSYLHLATHEEMGHPPDPELQAPFWHVIRNGMLDREPPDHTRLRSLVSKAFTPRRVAEMRDTIQGIVDRSVDEALVKGEFDLLADVLEPLPVTVIAELLGVPEADRHLLRPWSSEICLMYELNPSEEYARRATRASIEFGDYLADLSRSRRANPGSDLVSGLTQVVVEGDRLTEDELVGTCVLLLNAGHEASVNGSGNGWWALFRNPRELERLRADPSLLPTAVEELLRYDTPLQLFERWVLEDSEVCGVQVPRGAELGLMFGSSNRDPDVFADPDRLDLGRDPNPHISFGAGIHFCLGAPLARLEMQIAFETILRRMPSLELLHEPEWKPTYIIRGLKSLPVRA
ncbi:MAG TPA: cytochrome P450 [Methylomirabilota bacterium]|nr:cytochrome P450 [Methylomirabilota bacterium]